MARVTTSIILIALAIPSISVALLNGASESKLRTGTASSPDVQLELHTNVPSRLVAKNHLPQNFLDVSRSYFRSLVQNVYGCLAESPVPTQTVANVRVTSSGGKVFVAWDNTGDGDLFIVDYACQGGLYGSKYVFNKVTAELTGLGSNCNVSVAKVNFDGSGPISEPVPVLSTSGSVCPPDFVSVPFGCYHIPPTGYNLTNSRQYCASKSGSSLYSAQSLEEFEQVKEIFRNVANFATKLVIDLSLDCQTGNWYWSNGLYQPMGAPYWKATTNITLEPQENDNCGIIYPYSGVVLAGIRSHAPSFPPLCFIRNNNNNVPIAS